MNRIIHWTRFFLLSFSLLLVAGCRTVSLLTPINILEPQVGKSGQLHILDIEQAPDSVGPVGEGMEVYILTQEDLIDPERCVLASLIPRASFSQVGAFLIPSGTYLFRVQPANTITLKPDGTAPLLGESQALGSIPLCIVPHRITVVWAETMGKKFFTGRWQSKISVLGTLPDPTLDKATTLKQLHAWLRDRNPAKQYYAALFLAEIGDSQSIPLLRQLANQDKRFSTLTRKSEQCIEKRQQTRVTQPNR